MKQGVKNKLLRILKLILLCVPLASCAKTVVVNNCPSWVEVGTAAPEDTSETKRWMYRFETNRLEACK